MIVKEIWAGVRWGSRAAPHANNRTFGNPVRPRPVGLCSSAPDSHSLPGPPPTEKLGLRILGDWP